jgi:hypothetical protein
MLRAIREMRGIVADYTVGTVIVLVQLATAKSGRAARHRGLIGPSSLH